MVKIVGMGEKKENLWVKENRLKNISVREREVIR